MTRRPWSAYWIPAAALAAWLLAACGSQSTAGVVAPGTAVEVAGALARQPEPTAEPTAESTSVPTAMAVPAPTPSPSSTPMPRSRADVLREALAPLAEEYEERLGLVVEELGGSVSYSHNPGQMFPSASVYKVAVAHEVLRRVDQGELRLDDDLTIQPSDALEGEPGDLVVGETLEVGRALELLLGDSSNASAYALMRLIGRPELNAALVEMGLRQTSVPLLSSERPLPGSAPHDDEWAVTSAEDMARLLRIVASGEQLSTASRTELRRLLALEEPMDSLREGVPSDGVVLAKTGNLPGICNIVGLVEAGGRTTLVVVLTEDVDPDKVRKAISDIGQTVYTLARTDGQPADARGLMGP